ncbi:MAG: hypothetical protein WC326_09685 [Candidatus Delongbacteria bacterium]
MAPVALGLLALLLAVSPAPARQHAVPASYATIQAAIAACAEGDTVLVAPGVYHERLLIQDRAILLTSHLLLEDDTTLVSRTVVDGDSLGCVVRIVSAGPNATELRGLTVRRGVSGLEVNAPEVLVRSCRLEDNHAATGGGILVRSRPSLRLRLEGVEFLGNSATSGGALGFASYLWDDSLLVLAENCLFRANSATIGYVARVHGNQERIRFSLTDCWLERNHSLEDAPGGSGSLFRVEGGTGDQLVEVRLDGCKLVDNQVEAGIAQLEAGTGDVRTAFRADDCLFSGNQSLGSLFRAHAGTGYAVADLVALECRIEDNIVQGDVFSLSSGTGSALATLTADHCWIEGNEAQGGLLAAESGTGSSVVRAGLHGTTLLRNEVQADLLFVSANIASSTAALTMDSCVVLSNTVHQEGRSLARLGRGGNPSRFMLRGTLMADNTLAGGPVLDVGPVFAGQLEMAVALVNCTVADNHQAGAGLSIRSAQAVLVNSVLANDAGPLVVLAGDNMDWTAVGVSHCLAEGGREALDVDDAHLVWEEGNLDLPPLWWEGAPAPYTPALESLLVDAGIRQYSAGWSVWADTLLVDATDYHGAGPEIGWREVDAVWSARPKGPVALEPLRAWPNPCNGSLTVHVPADPRSGCLRLYDVAGRLVWEEGRAGTGLTARQVRLDLAGLPAGSYWLMTAGRPRDPGLRVTVLP